MSLPVQSIPTLPNCLASLLPQAARPVSSAGAVATQAMRWRMVSSFRRRKDETMRHRIACVATAPALLTGLAACGNNDAKQFGNVGIDWTGNDITVEAVADPDVKGVVCHLAYFNRSVI